MDLVYLLSRYGTVAGAQGLGDGTFFFPMEFPMTEGMWGMAVADLSGQGGFGIVTGNDQSGGINVVFIGNSQSTPTITWATPAAITVGTALSGTQLNATASVPGTFAYDPAAGTILPVGAQTLNVTFTPTDTTHYTTATGSVVLNVVDFNLTLSGTTTQIIQQGNNATYTFTIAPNGMSTFPAVVNLSASGLPTGATATFSPASLPANSGSTPVTLTVATTTAHALNRTAKVNQVWAFGIFLPLVGIPLIRTRRYRGKLLTAVLAMVAFGALATMQGCGDCDSDDNCKPKSTDYTIVITATSGSLSHSSSVTLTVTR